MSENKDHFTAEHLAGASLAGKNAFFGGGGKMRPLFAGGARPHAKLE